MSTVCVRSAARFAGVLLTVVIASILAAPSASAEVRVAGRPSSANGASSMVLDLERPLAGSAEAVLNVVRPPSTRDLHFWALQVSFVDDFGAFLGSAHLGLQWHPSHPGSTAVNFGGYDAAGRELTGTTSSLPSATGNPNTRDFAWTPGTSYRLAIVKSPTGWAAVVTDLTTGIVTAVRTLTIDAPSLGDALVFSEVFAACDAPSTVVRWSGLGAAMAHTRYQSHESGACTNTDQVIDADGVLHITNAPRSVAEGTQLLYHVEPTPRFVKSR